MDKWHEWWMRQPEGYRRAAGYGRFILNQPELDLQWEQPGEDTPPPIGEDENIVKGDE